MTGDSHSVPPILASLRGLVPRASRELVRVADWWLDHSVDHASGGYFGQVGLDGLPVAGVPLSAVLMSRILWFFSEVSRHTGDSRYLAESRRAKAYFESSFVDPVHGGIVWQVDHEGRANRDMLKRSLSMRWPRIIARRATSRRCVWRVICSTASRQGSAMWVSEAIGKRSPKTGRQLPTCASVRRMTMRPRR